MKEFVKFQFWAVVDAEDIDEVMGMDTVKLLAALKKVSPHFLSVGELSAEVLDLSKVEILEVEEL